MKRYKIFTVAIIWTLVHACTQDNVETLKKREETQSASNGGGGCDTSKVVTFSANIRPILENECGSDLTNCHNSTGRRGNCVLDTYDGIKKEVDNGRLLGTIRWESGYIPMPLGATSKIKVCDIVTIEKWVREGAQNK